MEAVSDKAKLANRVGSERIMLTSYLSALPGDTNTKFITSEPVLSE